MHGGRLYYRLLFKFSQSPSLTLSLLSVQYLHYQGEHSTQMQYLRHPICRTVGSYVSLFAPLNQWWVVSWLKRCKPVVQPSCVILRCSLSLGLGETFYKLWALITELESFKHLLRDCQTAQSYNICRLLSQKTCTLVLPVIYDSEVLEVPGWDFRF